MCNRIALGTVQFGLAYGVANHAGKTSTTEVPRILEEAVSFGINTLDTAVAYGESEDVLGQVGVSHFRIVTKLPALPEECADIEGWVISQTQASLQRLNVESVYAVLLHRPEQLLGPNGERLYKAMQRLRADGIAKKIGISIYEPRELDVLCARFDFDLVQAPLSLLDRRLVESGWAERLHHKGIELHVRSVFLQGLLLMPLDVMPSAFLKWEPVWSEWQRWLAEVRLTPLQACLRYVLSVVEVDRVVVGVDNLAQLRQITASCLGVLPSLPSWPAQVDCDLLNPAQWKYQ